MNKYFLKKIALVSCFLFLAILSSVFYNFKSTGAFSLQKKKMPIYSVETKEKKVAISFDISWGEDNTLKILDILDKYNVKATFFIVGAWIDENKEMVKEIHKRGHEIGNHSNKHPDMTKVSKEKIINEVAVADAKIKEITTEDTKLFRCPSGAYNELVVSTVESIGHYCIQWDVDSIDWKSQGAEIEYKRIMDKTNPGSILLFHNNGKYTPENLPRIIEELKKKGYSFVKVGDLIYKENYHIDVTGKQVENP